MRRVVFHLKESRVSFERESTEEEVLEGPMHCNKDQAPRPDRLNMGFL